MKKIINKEEALKAVEQDGMKLEECSDELRNDKDVVEAAVANREKAMMFVSEELKCDKEVIERALVRHTALRSEEGIAFSFLPDNIKDNEEIILMSIRRFGGAFQYISDRLKNDEDFLIKASVTNEEILAYVDSKYLKDKTFIKKILNRLKGNIFRHREYFARFLDATTLDDAAMMKEIITKTSYKNFEYISERLKDNKDFVLEILPIAPKVYSFLNKFHGDKDVTLAAVKADGMNLQKALWNLKDVKEVVLEAVRNNPHSIQFSGDALQEDEELWSYVTKDDSYYYNLLDPANGYRYDIPMLTSDDPVYFFKYIRYMKQKEQSFDTFEKMLRWG